MDRNFYSIIDIHHQQFQLKNVVIFKQYEFFWRAKFQEIMVKNFEFIQLDIR